MVNRPDALPEEILPEALVPIAERFADEGVPLRAIARSLKQNTEAVRFAVEEAVFKGKIVQVPRDDWPVGATRNDRTPSYVRANRVDDESMIMACGRIYHITRLQASLLVVLLNRNEVSKETLHQVIESRRASGKEETDPKMVDVVICNLRKGLKPSNITINTLWGFGYYMEPAQRRSILEMVNSYVNKTSAKSPSEAAIAEGEEADEG